MKVVGYLFEEAGQSCAEDIDKQRQHIADFATGFGVRVVRFYHEQESSGSSPFVERREAKRLLQELDDGDVMVVTRAAWVLSSASDGISLIHEFVRRRVSLYCLDLDENLTLPSPRQLKVYEGSAALVLQLLMALDENEKGGHAQSIRSVKRRMKKEGKYLGGPVPFGWRLEGAYLVVDREQQKIIREIRRLKEERWSYRDIARRLKEQYDIRLSHEGVRKVFLKNAGKEDLSAGRRDTL